MTDFNDYMPEGYEYGDPTLLVPGPPGWFNAYISSTFLNGWINYVKRIRAFTFSRYTTTEELRASVAAFHASVDVHTDLDQLQDDVLLLCREEHREDEPNAWWVFWYDRDCSDCCIGRFFTNDPDARVIELFEAWVRGRAKEYGENGEGGGTGEVFPLDVGKIRGWVRCM